MEILYTHLLQIKLLTQYLFEKDYMQNQELKHKYPMQEIGPYIQECNERNDKTKYNALHLKGVTSDGIFDATKAIVRDLDFSNYKVVNYMNIALADLHKRSSLGLVLFFDFPECFPRIHNFLLLVWRW